MGNFGTDLNRRKLLKLGAAGVAVAGSRRMLSQLAAQSDQTRHAPAQPITLQSPSLELVFDPDAGVPSSYKLTTSGIVFQGGLPLKARVCRREPWAFSDVEVRPASHTGSSRSADFKFTASYESGTPAVDFTLRYAIHGGTIIVTLEDIREHPGYEFLSLSIPALVSVHENERDAWLAHGDDGGDLVDLRDTKAGKLAPNTFWGEINGILPVIMTGHSGAVCVQETTAFMDGTLLSVAGEAPGRVARMGTTKVHRVDGSGCYDMNLGRGAPRSCGNQTTPNLLVNQKSSCRLDFLEPNGGKTLSWLDGARLVRARMPGIPNHYYDDKFIYGIRVDEPKFPKPSATFEQCEQIIREMHALTDGSPQLVHLWGWQFRGKDTGYPAVNVVNERVGGYEGMMRVMEKGKALNATVSISDNYDDAYHSSPAWNEDTIARKPDGDLWKSREWTGEESYIQGLAKYLARSASATRASDTSCPARSMWTCSRITRSVTIGTASVRRAASATCTRGATEFSKSSRSMASTSRLRACAIRSSAR